MDAISEWFKNIIEDITTTLDNNIYALLKEYTSFNDVLTIKAYAKTPLAEQKLICAIRNSGDIENVTIMNREADGVYTLRVQSRTLTTKHILQKRIARSIVE